MTTYMRERARKIRATNVPPNIFTHLAHSFDIRQGKEGEADKSSVAEARLEGACA